VSAVLERLGELGKRQGALAREGSNAAEPRVIHVRVLLPSLSLAHPLAVLVGVQPHVGQDVLRLFTLALPHPVVVIGRGGFKVLEHPQVVLSHTLHLPPPQVHVQAADRWLLQARLCVRSLVDFSHRGEQASVLGLDLRESLIILHSLLEVGLDHLGDRLWGGRVSELDEMGGGSEDLLAVNIVQVR